MKQGLQSVEKLVDRANTLAGRKRDYVADVRNTTMSYDRGDKFDLGIDNEINYPINNTALRQLSSWTRIPMTYINHLRENGKHDLVVDNFN